MEMLIVVLQIVSVVFISYQIGRISGVKQTFDYLEKEGKIIDKDRLKDLVK